MRTPAVLGRSLHRRAFIAGSAARCCTTPVRPAGNHSLQARLMLLGAAAQGHRCQLYLQLVWRLPAKDVLSEGAPPWNQKVSSGHWSCGQAPSPGPRFGS